MKNKIFSIVTSQETKETFFKRNLPGSICDNGRLTYKSKTYNICKCETVGCSYMSIAFYRLKEIASHPETENKILMPKELTAENGAKALLIGEFFEIQEEKCPECCGREVPCGYCDGSGSVSFDMIISWDNIKSIYKKAVENLGEKYET